MSIIPKIQNSFLQLRTSYVKEVIWWINWILECYSLCHLLFNWECWTKIPNNDSLRSSHIFLSFLKYFLRQNIGFDSYHLFTRNHLKNSIYFLSIWDWLKCIIIIFSCDTKLSLLFKLSLPLCNHSRSQIFW